MPSRSSAPPPAGAPGRPARDDRGGSSSAARSSRPRPLGVASRARTSRSCAARATGGTASSTRGNSTRPNISTGTMPWKRDRSSSTYCTKRDRLATTRMRLVLVAGARTRGPCGCPAAGTRSCRGRTPGSRLRSAIRRLIHHSSECGLACCGLDVDRLVVVLRVDDHRQVQLLRVGAREAGVAVARSTASACARRCGRRGRCCRPCRSRRRSR